MKKDKSIPYNGQQGEMSQLNASIRAKLTEDTSLQTLKLEGEGVGGGIGCNHLQFTHCISTSTVLDL